MNILSKKKTILMMLLLGTVSINTGCSTIDNIAMGLENETQTVTDYSYTTEDTIETLMTTSEMTTNVLNYTPFLTISPMYEPSLYTTLETTTYDTVATTTPFTETSTIEQTSSSIETTDTTSNSDITTIENITEYPQTTEPINNDYEPSQAIQYNTGSMEYYENRIQNVPIDSSYFFNDCAFIGDSLTVGLSMYDFIPKDYTFAQQGISISGMNSLQLYTDYGYVYPAQAVSNWNSKHVFILLGINGVSWVSNDKAIESYTELINNIRYYNPNVEDINIISVFPVAYSMEVKPSVSDGRILNSEVDAFNERLKAMAYSLNLNYIDVNSKLKNSYGYLPDELTVDGLHLTKSGYQKVMDSLLEYVQNNA